MFNVIMAIYQFSVIVHPYNKIYAHRQTGVLESSVVIYVLKESSYFQCIHDSHSALLLICLTVIITYESN